MSGILQAGSAILSAGGSISGGQAQQNAYNANAELEEKQGEIARGQSFSSAEQVWQKVQQTLGAQRAAYGAAGVDVGTGSPLEVMAESARRGQLARMATLFQGEAQQQTAQTQAALDRYAGKAAKKAGLIQAGSTLLTAGAKIADPGSGGGGGLSSQFQIPQWNS